MSARDPKAVAASFMEALASKDYAAWDDLVAEDAIIHYPYSPEFMPTRFDGREPWRDLTRQMFDAIESFRFYDVEMIATEKPGFIVVLAKSEADFLSGKTYTNDYVFFYRVVDGKIVEYWEHFNPLNILKVLAPD
jgi:uncharacterized protein